MRWLLLSAYIFLNTGCTPHSSRGLDASVERDASQGDTVVIDAADTVFDAVDAARESNDAGAPFGFDIAYTDRLDMGDTSEFYVTSFIRIVNTGTELLNLGTMTISDVIHDGPAGSTVELVIRDVPDFFLGHGYAGGELGASQEVLIVGSGLMANVSIDNDNSYLLLLVEGLPKDWTKIGITGVFSVHGLKAKVAIQIEHSGLLGWTSAKRVSAY